MCCLYVHIQMYMRNVCLWRYTLCIVYLLYSFLLVQIQSLFGPQMVKIAYKFKFKNIYSK